MSVDFNAVAAALAVRFGPTIVTAPSGVTNVRVSTSALPDAITSEPTVLVFPPSSIQIGYGPSVRKGVATYPVRFYIYQVRDKGRNTTLINKWLTSLYAQLDGQFHIGLSTYVTRAVVRAITTDPLLYPVGGTEFHGIELTVDVHFWEALSAVA